MQTRPQSGLCDDMGAQKEASLAVPPISMWQPTKYSWGCRHFLYFTVHVTTRFWQPPKKALLFVLPAFLWALCHRAKHLSPACLRCNSTGNTWMLNTLLLGRTCPAQRLSSNASLNSIPGTTTVLACGLEKKLVRELRSCRTWVSGWEKRWNLPLTSAVLQGKGRWRRENVTWFEQTVSLHALWW